MITKLSLNNFRNHQSLSLQSESQYILISGPNGSGKTSVLEAISMVLPGKGIRTAALNEITRTTKESTTKASLGLGWQLNIELSQITANSYYDNKQNISCIYNTIKNKKEILNDGKQIKSNAEILEALSIIWLIPEMDRMFNEGPKERRKFLDRAVYNFAKHHADDCLRYNYYLKSRLKLIKEAYNDSTWLSSIESSLAQLNIIIALRRIIIVKQINDVLTNISTLSNKPHLSLQGGVEDCCLTLANLLIEKLGEEKALIYTQSDILTQFVISTPELSLLYNSALEKLKNSLSQSRIRDKLLGQSTFGSHKSDLIVRDLARGNLAKHCSTGEQNSFLIALIIAQAYLINNSIISSNYQKIGILMLDDILAHLDQDRQLSILNTLQDLPIQTWITGTNLDYSSSIFKSITQIELS